MRVVLKKIYTRKVRSLKHMCMMKCAQQHFKSTLRRYLTPVEEIMRAFCTNDALPLTSDVHMQHFLNRLKNTNMYEKFGLHIPKHYRETIYMHQFYFNGIYSDQYNQYTLAYLLVIERILEKRYKWKRIDQNIHYCQIECYHIYIRRQKWDSNISLSIFMDSKMNDLMKHRHGLKSTHYIVNDSSHITDYMIKNS